MKQRFEKSIIFRFLVILAMICITFGFLRVSLSSATAQSKPIQQNLSAISKEIDQQVDSVLTRFQIEKNWCRKKEYAIPDNEIKRVERKVTIPPDIIPVQVNQALNIMAKRYGCRAIGSENLKENTVTIHIKFEEYIIESIILKTSKDLKRTIEKKQQRKI
jgi:hypothetical protein